MTSYKNLSKTWRSTIVIISIAAALIATIGVVMSTAQSKPRTLSINFGSHPAVSAVMQMTLNGRIVADHTQKGRNESGPAEYMDGQGDALDFEVAWYDIFEDRGYSARFRLHASDLTIVGMTAYASVRIVIGPGADVTATTTNLEVARLITEGRSDELANLPAVPAIVLAELCADQLNKESLLMQGFELDVERYKDSDQRAANDRGRARYLAKNAPLTLRCNQD